MKKTILVISFPAIVCTCNVLGQGNGNVGIGTTAPGAKLQVNHRSTLQSPSIIVFDSTGGAGSKFSFRRQGSNQEFEISYDGANLNYNPKEIGIDKSVPWQFKSNGRLGFGTTNPQGRMQINHRSANGDPAIALFDSANGNGTGIAFFKEGQANYFGIAGTPHQNNTLAAVNITYMGKTLFTIRGNGYVGPCDATDAPLEARLQVNHTSTNQNPAILVFDSSQGVGNTVEFRKQGVPKSFRLLSKPANPDQDARFAINYSGAQDGSGTDNANFVLTGNGRTGFGANNPQARLQINNRSGNNFPSVIILDSIGGTGTDISFRRQSSNREFAIVSDGTNMYYNPKEVGVDKGGGWAFLSTGQTGFGTTTPLGFVQLNHKGSALQPGLALVDSAGGNGNRIAFRKQGSNKQFRIRTDDFGGQDLELFSVDYSQGGVTHEDIWSASTFAIRRNGNIGMGTTTPDARLQINHTSAKLIPALTLVDSLNGIGNMISFSKLGSERRFRMTTDDFGGQDLELFSIGYAEGGVEHEDRWNTSGLTMNGSGNVGIGTSTSGARLQVNNRSSNTLPALVIVDSATGNGNLINLRKQGVSKMFSVISTPANQEANALLNIGYGVDDWATFPSSLMALRGNGRAGFGTTNPSGRVQINHRSSQTEPALILFDSTTGSGRMIEFRKENVTNSITCTGTVSDGAPSSLRFGFGAIGEGSSDVLIMKADGKVGINNSSPANALDVTGDVNLTGRLKVGGATGTAGQVLTSNGPAQSPSWQFVQQPVAFNAFSDLFGVPISTVVNAVPANERFDSNNDFNTATGEFVAPQINFYALNAHVAFNINAGNLPQFSIKVVLETVNPDNSVVQVLEQSLPMPFNVPAQTIQVSAHSIQRLTAGQKVRLKVLHTSAAGPLLAKVEEFSASKIY